MKTFVSIIVALVLATQAYALNTTGSDFFLGSIVCPGGCFGPLPTVHKKICVTFHPPPEEPPLIGPCPPARRIGAISVLDHTFTAADISNQVLNNNGGIMKHLRIEYNPYNQVFKYSHTLQSLTTAADLFKYNAFWLVVSDGPLPRGNFGYVILYVDVNRNRISAYIYDSNNNPNSYASHNGHGYINTVDGAITVTDVAATKQRTIEFTLDSSPYNSMIPVQFPTEYPGKTWFGLKIGPDHGGVWMHPSRNAIFTYWDATIPSDHRIRTFQAGTTGSYDDENLPVNTTYVCKPPEGNLPRPVPCRS